MTRLLLSLAPASILTLALAAPAVAQTPSTGTPTRQKPAVEKPAGQKPPQKPAARKSPAKVTAEKPSAEKPGASASAPTPDQQREFLREADVVSSRPIGKGVTGALRLTLSDGRLTHDAAFQSVDSRRRQAEMRDGTPIAGELYFIDSYRYNIAAYELARVLKLDTMMPVTVERRYRGEVGALSWWVDEVLMDETERERTGTQPPGGQALGVARGRQRMQVFAELIRDTDRNKGNVLYTRDWRVIMLDFTRAFRTQAELRLPQALTTCDRDLLAGLRTLTRDTVQRAVGSQLSGFEVDAVMKRRDLIVAHFDRLIQQRGEGVVLY